MSDATTKKVNTFIQASNHDLQSLFAKLKVLEELNTKLSTLLDDGLKKSCQVANLIGNRLVLLVENGAVATQLRFLVPDLLRKFQSDTTLQKIQDIQCKVQPLQSFSRPNHQTRKMPPLSPETAAMLREIAESITDPQLKKILMRIAERTK